MRQAKSDGWLCKVCGLHFRVRSELFAHIRESNHKHSKAMYTCKWCGKEWLVTQTGLHNHENHCKCNPNSLPVKVHLHTDETKKKISESRKHYIEEHPDEIPFKLNHSSKKSYPEEYFEELFGKEGIPLKYHLQVGRYELDFYNEELMKYVEIDGEQHFSEYMINHDAERDEFLLKLGWSGLRIRWSDYKALSLSEKKSVIDNIKLFMSTASDVIPIISLQYKHFLNEDRKLRLETARENGTLNCRGNLSNNKLSFNDIENRKQLIINSGIDLTKFGWVKKVSRVTGLTRRQIYKIVNLTDLKDYVYRR